LVGLINVDSRGNRRSSQILQLVPAYCEPESILCFQSRTFHSVFDYRPNFLAINYICFSWSFSSSHYCARRISDFKFHSNSTPFNLWSSVSWVQPSFNLLPWLPLKKNQLQNCQNLIVYPRNCWLLLTSPLLPFFFQFTPCPFTYRGSQILLWQRFILSCE
jgi:hypothetical protein